MPSEKHIAGFSIPDLINFLQKWHWCWLQKTVCPQPSLAARWMWQQWCPFSSTSPSCWISDGWWMVMALVFPSTCTDICMNALASVWGTLGILSTVWTHLPFGLKRRVRERMKLRTKHTVFRPYFLLLFLLLDALTSLSLQITSPGAPLEWWTF